MKYSEESNVMPHCAALHLILHCISFVYFMTTIQNNAEYDNNTNGIQKKSKYLFESTKRT